jgi:hypothetical protein
MITSQKAKWWLDAALFSIFSVAFFLDLTGLPLHQWVGLFGGLLAAYHLVTHWSWVKAVGARFFGKTSGRARLYYLVDAALLAGFAAILGTGLVISTWLNLGLTNYEVWRVAHVAASILTLGVAVLKIGLHWRWIAATLKGPAVRPAAPLSQPALARPAAGAKLVSRREFVKVMGVVGITSVIAMGTSLSSLQLPQASASTTTTSSSASSSAQTGTASQAAASSSAASTTCVLRCNKGCSYPGRCRRYVDSSGNGRCDLGECA